MRVYKMINNIVSILQHCFLCINYFCVCHMISDAQRVSKTITEFQFGVGYASCFYH